MSTVTVHTTDEKTITHKGVSDVRVVEGVFKVMQSDTTTCYPLTAVYRLENKEA